MAPEKRRLGSWQEFLAYWEASRDVEEEALGAIKALRASNAPDWDDAYNVRGTYGRHYTISLFLTEVLEDEYPELGEQIYKEVVDHFLEIAESIRDRHSNLPMYLWVDTTQRLLVFLGENPPIPKLRGRIRDFLRAVIAFLLKDIDKASLALALLRYQMFDELESFVENGVYEAIPPLFEAVVERMGEGYAHIARRLVRGGWANKCGDDAYYVVNGFKLVRSDARALYLLLDLATAHIDKYGGPYKLPGDDKERRRSVAY